jgi:hypothetical protein
MGSEVSTGPAVVCGRGLQLRSATGNRRDSRECLEHASKSPCHDVKRGPMKK